MEEKNRTNIDNLIYYTEANYSEYENAEEIVDFMTDIKNAALGNGSQEIQDVIFSKIKENKDKHKKFSIRKIFCNPFVGITMLINGCVCCGSALLSEDNFQTLWTTGVVSVLLGILVIYWAVRNIDFFARNTKNVYNIIKDRMNKN